MNFKPTSLMAAGAVAALTLGLGPLIAAPVATAGTFPVRTTAKAESRWYAAGRTYQRHVVGVDVSYPACGAGVRASHVVARYKMRRAGKKPSFRKATLYCGIPGSRGYGFRHLEPHIGQYFGGWGAFNFSITQTLRVPKKIEYRSKTRTYTHIGPIIQCFFSQGFYIPWTFYVATSSSAASIITAYGDPGKRVDGPCPP